MEILKYKTQQPHVATGKAGNNMLNRCDAKNWNIQLQAAARKKNKNENKRIKKYSWMEDRASNL